MTNVVKIATANGHSFDDFWDLCPKKVGKPLAKVKWDKITSEKGLETATLDRDSGSYVHISLQATPEELIEGMKRYRKGQYDPQTYKLKDDGRFTCHPATWLNQGRWLDG